MIILEILGRFFIEVLFDGIILGFFRLIGKGFAKLNRLIFRTKTQVDLTTALEKNYLYKKIVLTTNLNEKLKAGQEGRVLEIIDKNKVFAEFYNEKGNQIEFDNEVVFQVELSQIKLAV